MPFWNRRRKNSVTASNRRNLSTTHIITQEEQDAIWNETEECLRDIAITCKTRSGSWTEIGRKADKILWLMSETNDRLSNHPGKNAGDGSTDRLNYLTAQMVQCLEINILVSEMTFEVKMTVLGCVRDAQYQPGDPRVCPDGADAKVLADIGVWVRDDVRPTICWLKGYSRTGKSTIARTIAERMTGDGSLGGSFFCSRYFEDRSDPLTIFPTLAFQLSRRYPEFRSALDLRREYPTLRDQLCDLIVIPFRKSGIATTIIIDGLDECRNGERILTLLGRYVSDIPAVKFLITGRPEQNMRMGFEYLGESRSQTIALEREGVCDG